MRVYAWSGVFRKLLQDLGPLLRGSGGYVAAAHGDDAGHDRDDLRQVLVQRRCRYRHAYPIEYALDSIHNGLGLSFKIGLFNNYQQNVLPPETCPAGNIHLELRPHIFGWRRVIADDPTAGNG